MKDFEEGELFVYINGDKAEIGKVKRVNNVGDGYFCYYHEGDTAANTPSGCMYKLMNNYVVKATTLGSNVNGVIAAAYEVIKDRKGETVDGTFIKNE